MRTYYSITEKGKITLMHFVSLYWPVNIGKLFKTLFDPDCSPSWFDFFYSNIKQTNVPRFTSWNNISVARNYIKVALKNMENFKHMLQFKFIFLFTN
jgi:hypothetical protein